MNKATSLIKAHRTSSLEKDTSLIKALEAQPREFTNVWHGEILGKSQPMHHTHIRDKALAEHRKNLGKAVEGFVVTDVHVTYNKDGEEVQKTYELTGKGVIWRQVPANVVEKG